MNTRTKLKSRLVMAMFCLWLIRTTGARTIYVADNGLGDFKTIQAAIDDCNDGDIVIVAGGIYTGDGNRDIDFNGKAITIRSTDPNDPDTVAATVIDCNGTHEHPHRGFYFHNGEDADSLLDGLTIANGYQSDEPGGAIYCEGSSPTITNCVITGNCADRGGGIFCNYARPSITNCTISGNMADEAGGGIYYEYSMITADRCTFIGNSAPNGGGMYTHTTANVTLTSCVFAANSADYGGGLYLNESWSPEIANCTVAGNTANNEGGGFYCTDRSYPQLTNAILWANVDSTGAGQAAQIYARWPQVMFSCIQDDDPNDDAVPFSEEDNGNIDDDPMFVREPDDGGDGWGIGDNDDFGDLHLLTNSPCINAGFPGDYVARDSLDIDGQPRLIGLRIDMGADEAEPMVVVTKPQGGEIWASGSTHEIEWSSYGLTALSVLFSTDSGSNWQIVEANLSNTGCYIWHLPDEVDSNRCTILVAPSAADQDAVTIESGPFTIRPDLAGPTVQSKWKSLGGDFDRAGLSQDSGPQLGCVKWRFEIDGPVLGSVTAGFDGRVHIACEDGKLHTLDPNGSELWSYDANSPLLSSPTIGRDGTLYVGSESGKLYAIDINGNLRWTQTTDEAVYSSPAVSADGNSIYVGSQNGILYALGRDGSELWTFETDGPGRLPRGSILASPAVGADGTVYVGGLYDPNLYALDPNTGYLKWKCPFESGGWPFASPVIAEDRTIYQVLLYDPNLYAIEPDSGNIVWATNLADPCSGWFDPDYAEKYWDPDGWSEPALGPDGTIYVSFDDPYLRAVDPNGCIKWVRRLGMMGGFTLTVGNDGLVYAASDDGYLCVVNRNGEELARFRTDRWLNFPVIAADNTIIVGDSKDDSVLITDSNNVVWAITGQCQPGQALDLHRPEDLDGSRIVDFEDLALLSTEWVSCTDTGWPCNYDGEETYCVGDTNRDFYVDFDDLLLLANQWLKQD